MKGFVQPQTEEGVRLWTFSYLVPLHGTKFHSVGKKPPDMYTMHCSLFLILFATLCLGSYTCCAAGQTTQSSDGWSSTIIRNLIFAVRKPTKTWRQFPSRREIVRRSPRARRLVFRLPPYDTPRVAPRNNSEFHVDHTHAAEEFASRQNGSTKIYI